MKERKFYVLIVTGTYISCNLRLVGRACLASSGICYTHPLKSNMKSYKIKLYRTSLLTVCHRCAILASCSSECKQLFPLVLSA